MTSVSRIFLLFVISFITFVSILVAYIQCHGTGCGYRQPDIDMLFSGQKAIAYSFSPDLFDFSSGGYTVKISAERMEYVEDYRVIQKYDRLVGQRREMLTRWETIDLPEKYQSNPEGAMGAQLTMTGKNFPIKPNESDIRIRPHRYRLSAEVLDLGFLKIVLGSYLSSNNYLLHIPTAIGHNCANIEDLDVFVLSFEDVFVNTLFDIDPKEHLAYIIIADNRNKDYIYRIRLGLLPTNRAFTQIITESNQCYQRHSSTSVVISGDEEPIIIQRGNDTIVIQKVEGSYTVIESESP